MIAISIAIQAIASFISISFGYALIVDVELIKASAADRTIGVLLVLLGVFGFMDLTEFIKQVGG